MTVKSRDEIKENLLNEIKENFLDEIKWYGKYMYYCGLEDGRSGDKNKSNELVVKARTQGREIIIQSIKETMDEL